MPATCLNLRELFGDRYKIDHDPAAWTASERADPWMMTLPCARGVIYPHGPDTLALEVDGRRGIAAKVAAIPGVTLAQDGDWEKTFLFHVDLFERIAAIVKPRRRRQLSPEQRAASAARLAKHRVERRGILAELEKTP
jgi:hypothetical protein